ncbi:MAG: hypothetical protein ACO3ME_10270, partial [Ilumatobacteraceae bacterium]
HMCSVLQRNLRAWMGSANSKLDIPPRYSGINPLDEVPCMQSKPIQMHGSRAGSYRLRQI